MPIALFEGLTDDEQRSLLTASRVRMAAAREVVAAEGDAADFAALVQIGHLKLTRSAPDGTDVIVRYIGPGDPFAAIAVLPAARFPVTATAVSPARLLVWNAVDMRTLSDRIPRLKTNLMSAMSGHMTGALTRMQELTSERVPRRVANALLRLARDSGERTPAGWRILHPLTRQELADLTGTTLFTVSRLVSGWESEGLLRTSRGAMTVVDPDGLEAAADSESST
jgi:CRP-like cAMP-binding protein